jgi:hypothetical protein
MLLTFLRNFTPAIIRQDPNSASEAGSGALVESNVPLMTPALPLSPFSVVTFDFPLKLNTRLST